MTKHLLFMDNLTPLHDDLYVRVDTVQPSNVGMELYAIKGKDIHFFTLNVPASLFESYTLTILDGESVHVADATILSNLVAGKASFEHLPYEGQKTLQEIEDNSIIF